MFVDYAASLDARLFEKGYSRLAENIWGLVRSPILYVVSACDLSKMSPEEFSKRTGALLARLDLPKTGATQVVAVNILYAEGQIPDNALAFAANQEPIPGETISQVWWLAGGKDKTVTAGAGQPERVADLREIAAAAFTMPPPPEPGSRRGPAWTRPREHRLTVFLIWVNVLIFIVIRLSGSFDQFILVFANQPDWVLGARQYYRLLTSVFIHLSLSHVVFNALALYIFGSMYEEAFGRGRMVAQYLVCGVVGSVFSVLFTRTLSAGASGAIFGLMGGCMGWTLATKKRLSGFDTLGLLVFVLAFFLSGAIMGGVDHFAHLGGVLSGLALGYFQQKSRCSKPEKRE